MYITNHHQVSFFVPDPIVLEVILTTKTSKFKMTSSLL